MGENNDSFFNKMLLKNIDKEMPIDVNLIDTPSKTSKTGKLENYIDSDKKYDEIAESRHKKEILLELKNNFSAQTKESELLQSLKKSNFLS